MTVDGEYRARLMHTIRDLTADAFGGWKFVTNLRSGRGALKLAGLENEYDG